MTIEIKQLVVRAVVEPRREVAQAAAPAQGKPAAPRGSARAETVGKAVDLDALAAGCARQVLRELRRQRGR